MQKENDCSAWSFQPMYLSPILEETSGTEIAMTPRIWICMLTKECELIMLFRYDTKWTSHNSDVLIQDQNLWLRSENPSISKPLKLLGMTTALVLYNVFLSPNMWLLLNLQIVSALLSLCLGLGQWFSSCGLLAAQSVHSCNSCDSMWAHITHRELHMRTTGLGKNQVATVRQCFKKISPST